MEPDKILHRNFLVKKMLTNHLFVAQFNYWLVMNTMLKLPDISLGQYLVKIEKQAEELFHDFYGLSDKTQIHALYQAGAIEIQEMHQKIFASGCLQRV